MFIQKLGKLRKLGIKEKLGRKKILIQDFILISNLKILNINSLYWYLIDLLNNLN